MKAKLLLVIGFIGLLTGCCTFNPQAGNCNPPCQLNCNANSNDMCSCADPGCGSERCMDASTCCHVFGNIGGVNFQRENMTTIEETHYDNLAFVETRSYPMHYMRSYQTSYKGEL